MEHLDGCDSPYTAHPCDRKATDEPSSQARSFGSFYPWNVVSTQMSPFPHPLLTSQSVCITSIERLISLNFNATFAKDFTWATGTSVGVICACAPTLRSPLARLMPFVFGSTKHDQSYPLGDGVSQGVSYNARIAQRSKTHGGSEVGMEDVGTHYKGEGSEERIIGIQKTVSIELTYLERPGEVNTEGNKTYKEHRFDRHDIQSTSVA
jgi:hypothetical protein